MQLNIKPQDLYFFDIYLRELLIVKPVNSLRSKGLPIEKPKGIQLVYEVTFQKNGKDIVYEIKLQATQKKIEHIQIRAIKFDSNEDKGTFMEMLISRIREAERKAIEKPTKIFEYEAHLSSGFYPIKSTVEFGKYRLSPLTERSDKGYTCKLRFPVEAINKDDSLTWATYEAKHIAAYLSLIFGVLFRFETFSEITKDIAPITNLEEIERPDLRPVKHPFAGELKIPSDFVEIWNNYQSLHPDIQAAFNSSCICFQTAKEMYATNMGIAYLLFVTAIEVISKKVIKKLKPGHRFIEFICQSLGRSNEELRVQLGRFYGERSNVLHNQGIGLGFMPIGGIISFETVSGNELWRLEIYTNAALIGFVKNPEKFE